LIYVQHTPSRSRRLSIVPSIEQPLVILVSDNNVIKYGGCLLSTSATLCCKICCRTFGFSSSFEIFAIMVSANSFCCLFLTCPSYLTHESRTVFASAARAVFCSSSKASASSLAVSYSVVSHETPASLDDLSTFETSNSCFVISTTLLSGLTSSMRALTASACPALAEYRMSLIF
jgi:hypothetical protein